MTELESAVTAPEITRISALGHFILWASVLFIAIAFAWMSIAKLDKVARAQGKIIPAQKLQKIQNLEGGIVQSILVKEGQYVKKGQVLMNINDIRFSSAYQEVQMHRLALTAKIQRLEAELKGSSLVFKPEVYDKVPQLIKSEMALYSSQKKEMDGYIYRISLLKKELKMNRPLVRVGAISEVEVLRLNQKIQELEANLHNFRSSLLSELNSTKADLAKVNKSNPAHRDRLERTTVRSPVDGVINQVHIATIGGVITPGMDIMEIVPIDTTLRVEARVKPEEIGFIHDGQRALVKVSAYNYAQFGGLVGTVEHISADTSLNEKGESYYEVWIRTDRNYIGSSEKPLKIMPGMQATVDILTGKRTVLQYIMKPILRAKHYALTEQ